MGRSRELSVWVKELIMALSADQKLEAYKDTVEIMKTLDGQNLDYVINSIPKIYEALKKIRGDATVKDG